MAARLLAVLIGRIVDPGPPIILDTLSDGVGPARGTEVVRFTGSAKAYFGFTLMVVVALSPAIIVTASGFDDMSKSGVVDMTLTVTRVWLCEREFLPAPKIDT